MGSATGTLGAGGADRAWGEVASAAESDSEAVGVATGAAGRAAGRAVGVGAAGRVGGVGAPGRAAGAPPASAAAASAVPAAGELGPLTCAAPCKEHNQGQDKDSKAESAEAAVWAYTQHLLWSHAHQSEGKALVKRRLLMMCSSTGSWMSLEQPMKRKSGLCQLLVNNRNNCQYTLLWCLQSLPCHVCRKTTLDVA